MNGLWNPKPWALSGMFGLLEEQFCLWSIICISETVVTAAPSNVDCHVFSAEAPHLNSWAVVALHILQIFSLFCINLALL